MDPRRMNLPRKGCEKPALKIATTLRTNLTNRHLKDK
ncbi:hypothetical protein CJF31_00011092 [Rutstroemia sp. NJR-2017a BVV2]|nr:hypothetical protein CJF31_00009231 [Rutstroemia sp. NJR-2017a BVV2]PQE21720.1 hypothetical protein CJF31_00011092 [Rutstroemia sp. NJR-2017a BVV2]